MTYLLALILFILCFAGMAVGLLLSKKELKKRCHADPKEPCACEKKDRCNHA